MNKKVVVLLFSVISLFGIDFHTYKKALELQKKTKKTIMLDVVRTGCHYCEDMKHNVFQNPEMSQWMNERFIIAEINLDKQDIPLGLRVDFTPTFYFINENREVVKKIPGSWCIKDFKDLAKGIK